GFCVASAKQVNTEARSGELRGAKSAPSTTRSKKNVLLVPHFKEFLGYMLGTVKEVRSVLMSTEENYLRVYVVVDSFDFEANERIYDVQEHIMGCFTDVEFDFHITSHAVSNDSNLEVTWSRSK